jgi:hypothetical protein
MKRIPLVMRKLIIPLLLVELAIGVILYGTGTLDIPNLLMNLSSEMLGILVTVGLVDRVLDDREKERWKIVQSHASWDIVRFILDAVANLIDISGVGDELGMRIHSGTSTPTLLSPIAREMGYRITLEIDSKLLSDSAYIEKLKEKLPTEDDIKKVEKPISEGYRIIDIYRNQLTPEILEYMVKSLEGLRLVLLTFPADLRQLEAMPPDTQKTEGDEPDRERPISSMAYVLSETVKSLVQLNKILTDLPPAGSRRVAADSRR